MSQSLTREQQAIIREAISNKDGQYTVSAVAGSG